MLIGLCGAAGSGKDTIAEFIAPSHPVCVDGKWIDVRPYTSTGAPVPALRAKAVQIANADPMKEFCKTVYDFSMEQLWGASSMRNAPDRRYPRTRAYHSFSDTLTCSRCKKTYEGPAESAASGPCTDYLTPREALQQLGTEWGRACYANTWVELSMRRARDMLTKTRITQPEGTRASSASWIIAQTELVVVSDVRFQNEVDVIRAMGGQVWRIERPVDTDGEMYKHKSETEQKGIDPSLFAATLTNTGTLEDLRKLVQATLMEQEL